MSDRFPPLRPQQAMTPARSMGRALPTPAPIDLTLLAGFALVLTLALI